MILYVDVFVEVVAVIMEPHLGLMMDMIWVLLVDSLIVQMIET